MTAKWQNNYTTKWQITKWQTATPVPTKCPWQAICPWSFLFQLYLCVFLSSGFLLESKKKNIFALNFKSVAAELCAHFFKNYLPSLNSSDRLIFRLLWMPQSSQVFKALAAALAFSIWNCEETVVCLFCSIQWNPSQVRLVFLYFMFVWTIQREVVTERAIFYFITIIFYFFLYVNKQFTWTILLAEIGFCHLQVQWTIDLYCTHRKLHIVHTALYVVYYFDLLKRGSQSGSAVTVAWGTVFLCWCYPA